MMIVVDLLVIKHDVFIACVQCCLYHINYSSVIHDLFIYLHRTKQ